MQQPVIDGHPWDALANNIIRLNLKWTYWSQLFGTRDSVELLHCTAPSAFAVIQESVLFDVLTSIAQLIDPPKNRAQKNMVIEDLLSEVGDHTKRDALTDQLSSLKVKAADVVKIRHKLIAHADDDVAKGAVQLASVDSGTISEIIREINSLIRALELAAGKNPHVFTAPGLAGNAETLQWLLRKAYAALVHARSTVNGQPHEVVPGTNHVAFMPVQFPL